MREEVRRICLNPWGIHLYLLGAKSISFREAERTCPGREECSGLSMRVEGSVGGLVQVWSVLCPEALRRPCHKHTCSLMNKCWAVSSDFEGQHRARLWCGWGAKSPSPQGGGDTSVWPYGTAIEQLKQPNRPVVTQTELPSFPLSLWHWSSGLTL